MKGFIVGGFRGEGWVALGVAVEGLPEPQKYVE